MIASHRYLSLRPLVLTLLATILHFWALEAQSLWYDEGFSVWLAQKPLAEIVARTAADIQPPLYYILLHGWISLAGPSEWSLRFFSACFAILAVPLIWQLARALLRQPAAADSAALLVALSPLWLWYGREVRMYTLALALLLVGGLALLRLLRAARPHQPWPWGALLTFGLATTLAVYTHYYVWFVLVGWGLVAAGWWLCRPAQAQRRALLWAFAMPLLAYLPWVGVVVQRLGADRSYWEGTLDWRSVVEPALASWVVGHTLHVEWRFLLGWAGALLALLALLLLLGRTLRGTFPLRHLALLFFWLILPVVGLMAISWNRPKYHPRYLIFALPPFFMLLAFLPSWLWGKRWLGRAASFLLLMLLTGLFLWADYALFVDPASAKDDWRGVAAYLQAHRQEDEPILLVSGHSHPVFHYYYPEEEGLFRLPDQPTLDTSVVLGAASGEALASALTGAQGVWVVGWQDEVVDPEGVIEAFLQAAGGTRHPIPLFKEVSLTYWALPPNAGLGALLTPTHPLGQRFGEALSLLGWRPLPTPAPVDRGMALLLFWRAEQPLGADYKVRLSVVDAAGFEYGTLDQRPTSYLLPTFRWSAGETRLAALQIPLLPGTPPGSYWVDVSVYEAGQQSNLDILDEAGAPQGQVVRLGPVEVGPAEMGWLGAPPPHDARLLDASLLDKQTLLAVQLALPAQLEPGQRLPLTLWWRTSGPLPGATLHLGWERGSTLIESEARPAVSTAWPGRLWRAGDLLMTPLQVRVPRTMGPGMVRLVAWLSDGSGRQSEPVTLATGTIVSSQRTFEPPPIGQPQAATFGGQIRLLGYDLSAAALQPGGSLSLTLHWQAMVEMERSLTTFVHLLDSEGRLIPGVGQDRLPLAGERPTDAWMEEEILSDTFLLALPLDAPPGPYTIEVGWYEAGDPTFPRLPAEGQGADRDRVLLDTRLP